MTTKYEYLRIDLIKSISDSLAFHTMKSESFRCLNKALQVLSADSNPSDARDERIFDLLKRASDSVDTLNVDLKTKTQISDDLKIALEHFQPIPSVQQNPAR